MFCGAPVLGLVYEQTGSYAGAAILVGISTGFGALAFLFLHVYVRHRWPVQEQQNDSIELLPVTAAKV